MTLVASAAEPTRQAIPRSRPDLGASLFVWGIWLLMLLAALAFAARYGPTIPHMDDWFFAVPVVTGEQPITAAWLWAPFSEYRLPLTKLIIVAVDKYFGFRAGIFFNAFALGALSFAMIGVAKRLRGRTSYWDAFFPLALLHWGSWAFAWSGMIFNVLPMALASTLLLIILLRGTELTLKDGLLFGICLVLLSLCGPAGLAYVPALALWLGYAGLLRWSSLDARSKRNGLLLLSLAMASLIPVVLYVLGYEKPAADVYPPSSSWLAPLKTSAQFLSMGFGYGGVHVWPSLASAVLALLLMSAMVLVLVWRKHPGERGRALGLFLFMGSTVLLALGIGWARSGSTEGLGAGLQVRYVLLAVPVLISACFVLGLYSTPVFSRFAQICLLILMCILLPLNMQNGLDVSRYNRKHMQSFARDLLAGTPPFILAERYSHFFFDVPARFYPDLEAAFAHQMLMLREKGVKPFTFLRDDPTFHEVALPVAPAASDQMTWENGIGCGLGTNFNLTFVLEKPQFVYAVRLKYAYRNPLVAAPFFQMSWKAGQGSFSEAERNSHLSLEQWPSSYGATQPGEGVVTIWINETIDQFRIYPDNRPCIFQISELKLLVPIKNSQSSS